MAHLYQNLVPQPPPPPPTVNLQTPYSVEIMDLDGTLDKCNHESASCSDHITNEHFLSIRVERPTVNNISDSTHPCFCKSLLMLYFDCRSLLSKLWWTCCYLCHWQSGHCVSSRNMALQGMMYWTMRYWFQIILLLDLTEIDMGGGCCYVHSWKCCFYCTNRYKAEAAVRAALMCVMQTEAL